jgi:hypothetical protein
MVLEPQPEIGEIGTAGVIDHDILPFDVTVHDGPRMAIIQTLHKLAAESMENFLENCTILTDEIHNRTTGATLENAIKTILTIEHFREFDNVRAGQLT